MIGRPRGPALLLGTVVAVVLVVLGVGLWIVGSPAEQRRKALDEERVEALRDFSEAIDDFYEHEGALPDDLDTLTAWKGLDEPRQDPTTEEPYAYQRTGERDYRLCASFALASTEPLPRRAYGDGDGPSFWHHPAGRKCFDLQVKLKEDNPPGG